MSKRAVEDVELSEEEEDAGAVEQDNEPRENGEPGEPRGKKRKGEGELRNKCMTATKGPPSCKYVQI